MQVIPLAEAFLECTARKILLCEFIFYLYRLTVLVVQAILQEKVRSGLVKMKEFPFCIVGDEVSDKTTLNYFSNALCLYLRQLQSENDNFAESVNLFQWICLNNELSAKHRNLAERIAHLNWMFEFPQSKLGEKKQIFNYFYIKIATLAPGHAGLYSCTRPPTIPPQ